MEPLKCTLLCAAIMIISAPFLVLGDKKLHLVNVLYRHGDRSPTETYPNSKYQEDTWPQGFGELSTRGMNMQQDLGQYLGMRYQKNNTLLSTNYSRYEIYIRSTDVNRTLMSAQANLLGLYPPVTSPFEGQPTLLWQPIPVHTVPIPDDYVLRTMGPPCPKYDKLHNETLNSDPEYLQLSKDNAPFLAKVSKLAGFKDPLALIDAWKLHDPLFIEALNGYPLPEWADNATMEKLNYLSDLGMYFLYNTKEKAKLKAGNLVGTMIKNMMASQSTHVSENKRQKMWMYSAHDTTLTAFMSVLGIFNKETPPLASCVGLDLIKDDASEHKYYVEIWFHNDTKPRTPPYKLTLPGCNYSCPIQDFIELTRDIVPDDIKKDCGVTDDGSNSRLSLVILIVIVSGILALCIIGLLLVAVCRYRGGEPRHTRLPSEDVNA